MISTSINRFTRSFVAASVFALAACSSPNGNTGVTPVAMQPSSVSRIPSGTSPKAQLYISDSGTNEVEVFGWPKPKTGSALSGSFSEPQGECADQSGDVFITNTGESNVLEYALGSAGSIATIQDGGEYPVGCSFDTQNGNLAVSNIISTNDGPGSVSIYKDAGGTPKDIMVTGMSRVYFLQYDGLGDLFAIGEDSSSEPALAEMKAGSNKFKVICPGLLGEGNDEFPGGIGWDGTYIVIGGFDTGVRGGVGVQRIKNCKPVGSPIPVGGDVFTIVGNRLVAPDAGAAAVEIYSYPEGALLQTLTGFSEPIGAAVAQERSVILAADPRQSLKGNRLGTPPN
jgi:hypothetical protein